MPISPYSGNNLLIRKIRDVGTLTGVFKRNRANLPFLIDVNRGVVIEIVALSDICHAKLDIQRI